MPMSAPPCLRFTDDMESQNRVDEIRKQIARADYEGISLEEYMQVTFMDLMDSGKAEHLNTRIMYGGNVFALHSCVEQILTSQATELLREKQ